MDKVDKLLALSQRKGELNDAEKLIRDALGSALTAIDMLLEGEHGDQFVVRCNLREALPPLRSALDRLRKMHSNVNRAIANVKRSKVTL